MASLQRVTKRLSLSDRRAVSLFISDIRKGREEGVVHKVYQYCPEYCNRDLYTPPNFDFTQCFLISNTKALHCVPNSPSLKNLCLKNKDFCENQEETVNGVVITREGLLHAMHGHTVVDGDRSDFQIQRCRPQFRLNEKSGNSVLISRNMLCGLIKTTLLNPDKITLCKDFGWAHEKAFKTEIGHSTSGCCHLLRVISKPDKLGQRTLATAYPTNAFLATYE